MLYAQRTGILSGVKSNANLVIASDLSDVDLYSLVRGNTAWTGQKRLFLNVIINSGVTISASSVATAALTVAGFDNARSIINIYNNGSILGVGGAGGAGGYQGSGSSGGSGGNAVYLASNCFIDNSNGVLGSGSGGNGGDGGSINIYQACDGAGSCCNFDWQHIPGNYGNCSCGCGGPSRPCCYGCKKACCSCSYQTHYDYYPGGSGIGGATGGGTNGSAGYGNNYSGGSGGSAGYYLYGSSYLTSALTGTLRGYIA